MKNIPVGIIGFGSIGKSIIASWQQAPLTHHKLDVVLARPHQIDAARAMLGPRVEVTSDIGQFIARRPRIVVEAAGHAAVVACAHRVLASGARLMVLSAGALADEAFRQDLLRVADAHGGKVVVPIGAIAGIDGLLALRRSGLDTVRYTSTKPPVSWKGTIAEDTFDLDALTVTTIIFEGNAAQAAASFPKNANIAATVAMAGSGFSSTRVVLVADPSASGNSGRIEAFGAGSRLEVTVAGEHSAGNPKTSLITGLSVLSLLENEESTLSFR